MTSSAGSQAGPAPGPFTVLPCVLAKHVNFVEVPGPLMDWVKHHMSGSEGLVKDVWNHTQNTVGFDPSCTYKWDKSKYSEEPSSGAAADSSKKVYASMPQQTATWWKKAPNCVMLERGRVTNEYPVVFPIVNLFLTRHLEFCGFKPAKRGKKADVGNSPVNVLLFFFCVFKVAEDKNEYYLLLSVSGFADDIEFECGPLAGQRMTKDAYLSRLRAECLPEMRKLKDIPVFKILTCPSRDSTAPSEFAKFPEDMLADKRPKIWMYLFEKVIDKVIKENQDKELLEVFEAFLPKDEGVNGLLQKLTDFKEFMG